MPQSTDDLADFYKKAATLNRVSPNTYNEVVEAVRKLVEGWRDDLVAYSGAEHIYVIQGQARAGAYIHKLLRDALVEADRIQTKIEAQPK